MDGPTKRKETNGTNAESANKKQEQNEEQTLAMTHNNLELILGYLKDEDLVTVLDRDIRLLPIVKRIIKGRYGGDFGQCIELSNKFATSWPIKLLNYCGSEIESLELSHDEKYRHFDRIIEKSIVENCSETLEWLRLINPNCHSFFEIDKPFENVTCLDLIGGSICPLLPKFSKWFPNVERVQLENLVLHKSDSDEFHSKELIEYNIDCRHFTELYIENVRSEDGGNGYMEKMAEFITRNPALKYLSIFNQDNADELIAQISEMKPNMPNLQLELRLDKPVGTKAFHFQELKELSFHCDFNTLNITVEKLGRLYLNSRSVPFGGQWLQIFENNKNVNQIYARGEWDNNEISSKFINLIKASSTLKILDITAECSMSQILELVSCCDTLNKISFHLEKEDRWRYKEDVLKAIFNSLEPKWKYRHHYWSDNSCICSFYSSKSQPNE